MMDIDKLEAGPETDALVAENVMGWILDPEYGDPGLWKDSTGMLTGWCSKEWSEESFDDHSPHYAGCAPELFTPKGIFRPSANWSATGDVVEALKARGIYMHLDNESGYEIMLFNSNCGSWDRNGVQDALLADIRAETFQLAVCRAALKAVNVG